MNGINKTKVCESTDRGEGNDDDEDLAKPSTSRAGMADEPNWNSSTRQLYENNLKSSSIGMRGAESSKCPEPRPRERLPSATDSNSSDDSCVYMYKGEDGDRNRNDVNNRVNCSSPEMDYLEMDFDPCQSNGHDSSDGSYNCDVADLQNEEGPASLNSRLNPYDSNEEERNPTPNFQCPSPNVYSVENNIPSDVPEPSIIVNCLQKQMAQTTDSNDNVSKHEINYEAQTPNTNNVTLPPSGANTSSEAESETEELQPSQDSSMPEFNECTSEQNVILRRHIHGPSQNYYGCMGIFPCCLATISRALQKLIITEDAISYVPEYNITSGCSMGEILTRLSNATLNVPKVQELIDRESHGAVTTKFIPAHSSTVLDLSSWLDYWRMKDAVILLCLNFHITRNNCTELVNSSWHYHIVHGVSTKGVQLEVFDQIETVCEETLRKLFTNPSEVLILKDYILANWTPATSMRSLVNCDNSWREYNVLGQVVNVIREGFSCKGKLDDEIKYVKLPSSHRTGFLIMMHSDNKNLKTLLEATDIFSSSL